MKNKIIDLFCGCGGLSYGFEKAGFEIALALDIWEDAIQTYNHNHNNSNAKVMNIENLDDKLLSKFNGQIVGVIGGPPCQGFSTVGKRNIDDIRNKLYLEYCRVVEVVNPEFFVIENVKGLLTLGKGVFKNDIINRFSNLGYNVSWKLLNASKFGVPQNRERVFFIGIKNHKIEFPESNEKMVTTYEALSDIPYEGDAYACNKKNEYQILMRKNHKSNLILNHVITKHTSQTKNIISKVPNGGNIMSLPKQYWGVRKYNKAFQRMNSNLPSNTIDTGHRNYFHYIYNRIPTVRESARLQSFPDDFEFIGTKTSQYKQVGNAVPPLLSYKIAKKIRNILEE